MKLQRILAVGWIGIVVGCGPTQDPTQPLKQKDENGEMISRPAADRPDDERWARTRHRMVQQQLRARDITDPGVLKAMAAVPRHLFVPESWLGSAYDDSPLPIGHDQTISQPYIVALMTQLVRPTATDRVLEVGTGCGYQAAVLAELAQVVYSIEIVEHLAREAEQRLQELGFQNVTVRHGDGYQGWSEHAPFDVIVVTAAPDHVPPALIEQLAPGGRMVIPVGRSAQTLKLIERQADGQVVSREVVGVRFVPMTGQAGER